MSNAVATTKTTILVLCAVFAVLYSPNTSAQSVEPLPLEIHRPPVPTLFWVPVKRMCGRLQTAQEGLVVTAPKTRIELYGAKWRQPCCKGSNLVGSQLAGENGDFDFEQVLGGQYWLVVKWNTLEQMIAIDVDIRREWEGSCENQGVSIEKQAASWFNERKPIM
jgi:hypothetical protein